MQGRMVKVSSLVYRNCHVLGRVQTLVWLRYLRCFTGAFPWSLSQIFLWKNSPATCEGKVTKCGIRDALKQVSLNKSPGLDGLPYEIYLKLLHIFVPILTDVFNHLFAQGAILGHITKGVNALLNKGDRHGREGLVDLRPITAKHRVGVNSVLHQETFQLTWTM